VEDAPHDFMLDDARLEDALCRAAQRGATEALKRLGLDDENAGRDVGELRSVLGAWRDMKREVWRTAARWATLMILGTIVLLLGSKLGFTIKSGP
jgi:hypothetical protein